MRKGAERMEIKEALRLARLMLAYKERAASIADYFGRLKDAEQHRDDIAALEMLIDIAEQYKAAAE